MNNQLNEFNNVLNSERSNTCILISFKMMYFFFNLYVLGQKKMHQCLTLIVIFDNKLYIVDNKWEGTWTIITIHQNNWEKLQNSNIYAIPVLF